jgi:hypothetical protein
MGSMFLSIVIAAYNMQREIPRTLATLSPLAQKAVSPDEYEVIVVDNGSPVPINMQEIDTGGVNLRIVRHEPEDANPSPVFCLNESVKTHARGDAVLMCIDGARMFSSHLVRRTIDNLTRYPRAVTYVASRHLGPKKQMQSVLDGYDQRTEDRLLETVDWRKDPDALFSISCWAGAHKPQSPILQNESNALGMRLDVWDALGGYNEGFVRPGGGLCNLELFRRILTRDDGPAILLHGETTFHQFHGGAATSNAGYFGESLGEYLTATGHDYDRPPRTFLVDHGFAYNRPSATGCFWT